MSRKIELNNITKVEGHAKLFLKIGEDNVIEKCELESIEGSRYFEGMLLERDFIEASEISSRICGICSCAHVVCAIEAMEKALDVKVTEQTMLLRRLFTMGERIRSHVTHIYFLVLPDYFNVESGLELAKTNKEDVLRALRMLKLGNDMIEAFAGRDLHPVSATVGGFLHFPTVDEIKNILERLKECLSDGVETVTLMSSLDYPDFDTQGDYISLAADGRYATMEGELLCSTGESYKEEDFLDFIKEYHEERSTSNFVVKDGKSYMVGALSRLNNSKDFLSEKAKKALNDSPFTFPSSNPFLIPFAQSIEVVHFMEESINILENMNIKNEEIIKVKPKSGRGVGVIEVPRGILVHEYELDEKGKIIKANIVTPTAQNLRFMEDKIREFLPTILHMQDKELILELEKLIRAFDPCFSCSTHFLDVTIEGREK